MKWIRRNILPGTWLALTALVLNLILTFGHIHAEPFSPSPESMAAAPVAVADVAAADDGSGATTERQRMLLRAHLHCAVCTSVDLLGTSILPVRHVLLPPPAILGSPKLTPSDILPAHARQSSAKARAPPSA